MTTAYQDREAYCLWRELRYTYPQLAPDERTPQERKRDAERAKVDLFGNGTEMEVAMPIATLTRKRQFVEIGQLRKGGPKTDPKRPGPDLTYFRATFNEGEEEAARLFFERYGSEPREINIVLPFDDVDENFETWMEAYLRGGLIYRGDGERIMYAVDPDTGETLISNWKDRDGKPVAYDGSPVAHWVDRDGHSHPVYPKQIGRFKVIVPELTRLAFMTALTGSWWDIHHLLGQLDAIKYVNNGILKGVPLVLKRGPKEISTPGPNGKKVRRTKWLLTVEGDAEWVAAKLEALRMDTLPTAAVLELPPGIPENDEWEPGEPPKEAVYKIDEVGQTWEHESPEYEIGSGNLCGIVTQYLSGELPLPGWITEIQGVAAAHSKADESANNGAIESLLRSAEKRVTPEQFYAVANVILRGRGPEEMTVGEYVALQGFIKSNDFEAQVVSLLS